MRLLFLSLLLTLSERIGTAVKFEFTQIIAVLRLQMQGFGGYSFKAVTNVKNEVINYIIK